MEFPEWIMRTNFSPDLYLLGTLQIPDREGGPSGASSAGTLGGKINRGAKTNKERRPRRKFCIDFILNSPDQISDIESLDNPVAEPGGTVRINFSPSRRPNPS
jgi:hypothetical protein